MGKTAWVAAALIAAVLSGGPVLAQDKPVAVTTFSILADLTQRIAGEHVQVVTLVGPNGDAHVFQPGPRVSAALAAANVLIANGLGFEPWLDRLMEASSFTGTLVVASEGIGPLEAAGHHEADVDAHGHEGGEFHAQHHSHGNDPHAFQDPSNALIYVDNIAAGLSNAVPARAADFKRNADRLRAEIAALDTRLKSEFDAVPPERRRILTAHDAFRYFGRAYGIAFVSVQGVSTEAEASAEDLVTIIRAARAGQVSAIFLENMSDPRLAETVAQESGVRIGGALHADALTDPSGPAPDYLSLIRTNAEQLLAAMR